MSGGIRYTPKHWIEVRAGREAGLTFQALSEKYNMPITTISNRARAEGWGSGEAERAVAQARAEAKVNAAVPLDESKREAALEEEAERRAALLSQHRDEPKIVRERLYTGIKAHRAATKRADKLLAFEDLKAAKIASETLINLHRVERQAWGYESGMLLGDGSGTGAVCVEVVFVNASHPPQGRLINSPESIDHEADRERSQG